MSHVALYGIRRSLIVIGSITEVKQRCARFIIGWVTAWDCQVLYTVVGLREPRKSDGSSIFLELDLDITSNDISRIPLQTVKEHLVKKDTYQWKLIVASKPKLRTYALFKINLKTELCVSLLFPKCKRSIFCQFRSGIL